MRTNKGPQAPKRPEIEGELPIKNMRGLAAQLMVNAIEAINKRKTNLHERTDWRKDVWWIHNKESNYELWCAILDLDMKLLQAKYPIELLSKRDSG